MKKARQRTQCAPVRPRHTLTHHRPQPELDQIQLVRAQVPEVSPCAPHSRVRAPLEARDAQGRAHPQALPEGRLDALLVALAAANSTAFCTV